MAEKYNLEKLKKFLVFSFSFAICALSFTFVCYALNLDRLKVLFLNCDYKSAINEGEKLIAGAKDESGLDELYYILGLSYLKDGNTLRASDIFEIILNEFKDSAFKERAKLGLGDTYWSRGDIPSAEKCYKEIIAQNPQTKLKQEIDSRLSQIDFGKGCSKEYSIQVGAFANEANAKGLMQKLSDANYPAFVEGPAGDADNSVYRVKVGKLSSLKEAEELEKKLSQEGYPTKILP
jgi:tetratricopeptide (TPR) repeat protein